MAANVGGAAGSLGAGPAGKATATSRVPSDSQAVARRLQSELMQLMTSADAGISAFPESDNIFNWVGTITGGAQTVYEGLKFKLTLTFPSDYPFKAPTVRFDTQVFHPNVDTAGNICLDILKDKWSAVHNVRTILLSIQSLLGEPNNESPLNGQAAALWDNQDEFRRVLLQRYSSGPAA